LAGEEVAIALFGVAAILYIAYTMNKERKMSQEILVEMKGKFFPKLLENLRTIGTDLEAGAGIGSIFFSNALDEGLSKNMLWQFGIRFLKLNRRLNELRKSLGIYDKNPIKGRGTDWIE